MIAATAERSMSLSSWGFVEVDMGTGATRIQDFLTVISNEDDSRRFEIQTGRDGFYLARLVGVSYEDWIGGTPISSGVPTAAMKFIEVTRKPNHKGKLGYSVLVTARDSTERQDLLRGVDFGENGTRTLLDGYKTFPKRELWDDPDLNNGLYFVHELPDRIDTMATVRTFMERVMRRNFRKPELVSFLNLGKF